MVLGWWRADYHVWVYFMQLNEHEHLERDVGLVYELRSQEF